MAKRIPVGIKNNNFWNLKKPGSQEYKGTIGYDSQGHAIFSDPTYSARAFIRNMRSYQSKGHNTLLKIFSVYAPQSDPNPLANNRPEEYAKFIAGRIGCTIHQKFELFASDTRSVRSLPQLRAFMAAVAEMEIGAGFQCGSVIVGGIALYNSELR